MVMNGTQKLRFSRKDGTSFRKRMDRKLITDLLEDYEKFI